MSKDVLEPFRIESNTNTDICYYISVKKIEDNKRG